MGSFVAFLVVIAVLFFLIPGEVILKTIGFFLVVGLIILLYKVIKIYMLFKKNFASNGKSKQYSHKPNKPTNNKQSPFETDNNDVIEVEFKELHNDEKN